VAPSLYGGLTLALPTDSSEQPMRVVQVPVPKNILCVLIHPHMRIETRQARSILKPDLSLHAMIRQSACLAGFLAGCYQDDLGLIREFMRDIVIEPQRSTLIPGFDELKKRAFELGALGFSISGAGPSVFAWAEEMDSARRIEQALVKTFRSQGLQADGWVSPILLQGARRIA
jgi:homoserine kinase